MANVLINVEGMNDREVSECWDVAHYFRLLMPDMGFYEPFELTGENLRKLYFDVDQKFKSMSYQVFQRFKSMFENNHFDMVVVLESASDPSDEIQKAKVTGIHGVDVPFDVAFERGDDYSLIFEWHDSTRFPNGRPNQWRYYGTTLPPPILEGYSSNSMDFCDLSF